MRTTERLGQRRKNHGGDRLRETGIDTDRRTQGAVIIM